ncbi:VOC family protein [Streptomyces candidus]|uniref:Catechol 2,3-dioxygenase-like lactoylglutathione lyase family enzyme n=1 Tax=Streptomyces candidus TaxID=67283 RepID=A0A7X0LNS3_9ACTN|nr:VOC family protein [Streptomyces candidus]MBB6434774.1 catechol 2,3-dioxygenase-like lactoylglutathione lyase family enzyme [Streptomyces candidus]GHH41955.1 glyoxalase [Streptomyces candidus]
MPIAKYDLVALDCPDPATLSAFYADILGGEVERSDDDWWVLSAPGGHRIAFQRVAGHRPPEWPNAGHNSQQLHLDFDVPDLDKAEEQVLALGAKVLDADDRQRSFRVYADPAGHPFCLCRE